MSALACSFWNCRMVARALSALATDPCIALVATAMLAPTAAVAAVVEIDARVPRSWAMDDCSLVWWGMQGGGERGRGSAAPSRRGVALGRPAPGEGRAHPRRTSAPHKHPPPPRFLTFWARSLTTSLASALAPAASPDRAAFLTSATILASSRFRRVASRSRSRTERSMSR